MLGVLGGMGPLATADFLAKLVASTDAERDQDHVPVVIWSDPRVPDRTEAILRDGASPAPALRHGAAALARMGAAAIAMPCNTAHRWADEIERASARPLIHIADAALGEVRWAGRVALLATAGTVAAGVYEAAGRRAGVEIALPSPERQRALDWMIAAVKGGRVADARALMSPLLREALGDADAAVLACTELPLAVPDPDPRVVDATAALARTCVRWWTGVVRVEAAA